MAVGIKEGRIDDLLSSIVSKRVAETPWRDRIETIDSKRLQELL